MFIPSSQHSTILNQLSSERLNVLLIAEKSKIDIQKLIEQANAKGIRLAGGIFPMIIYKDQHLEDGIIIRKLETQSESHIFHNVHQEELDHDLPDFSDDINSCLLFLDGLMPNIPRFLDRLYEKYWNTKSFFGAGCGSLSLKQSPCVFTNDGIFQDAALLIGISSKTQLGVKHGWKKLEGPIVANKTDKNKIIELNWRPAFEVYKEIIESNTDRRFDDEDFFEIAQAHPFGIFRDGDEDIVRDPLSLTDDGAIVCIGEVNQNVSLNVLKGNKIDLITCAGEASSLALDRIDPNDFMVVDCITRVLCLGDDFKKELEAVSNFIPESRQDMDLEGVLSLGEISSGKDGYLELYNKTIVVAAFYNT